MPTDDEIIKSYKSLPKREVMLIICNSITESNDMIGQLLRTHLWAEGFIDLILYQTSEDYTQKSFALKQKRLFELGLIDDKHNQELNFKRD